jgi:hypothetical protein
MVVSLLAVPRLAQAQWFGGAVLAQNFHGSSAGGPQSAELVVGTPDDGGGGSVTVFWRVGTTWQFEYIAQDRLGGSVFSGSWENGFESGDNFGHALASGDFDGDGFMDLAIGVPFEDSGSTPDHGCVHILYGAASGPLGMPFRPETTFLIRTAWNGFASIPSPKANAAYGHALAVADFNRDGKDDLAIGAPGTTINGQFGAGAVYLMVSSGSWPLALQYELYEGSAWTPLGVPEAGDQYGYSLAVRNFNGDVASGGLHVMDLAVGVPGQDVSGAIDAGAVNVYYGSTTSFPFNTGTGQRVTQGPAGDSAEAGDGFGTTLAAGNFNNSGAGADHYDLAIGAPYETVNGHWAAGMVNVVYGSPNGLGLSSPQVITSATFGTAVADPHPGAYFGWPLAAADFINMPNPGSCPMQGCKPTDLAIGEAGRNVPSNTGTRTAAGRVYLLQGRENAPLNPQHTTTPVINYYDGSVAFGFYGWSIATGQIKLRPDETNFPNPLPDLFIGQPGAAQVWIAPGGHDSGTPSTLHESKSNPW